MKKKDIYINEVIRINYKCNWECKFCNVIKVNNFWIEDVNHKEVILELLKIKKKYSKEELERLHLSISWGEPTLNKNLIQYIKFAKEIWFWTIQLQTNGSLLFLKKELILDLIDSWLDEIFLAQHSHLDEINKQLWCYYNVIDFIDWIKFIKDNNLRNKISLIINIVITKINLPYILDYLKFLKKIWFLDLFKINRTSWVMQPVSLWLVQPHWYAEINKEDILLKYNNGEVKHLKDIISYSKKNNINISLHYTSPPLCILDYPEYNLEYKKLKELDDDFLNNSIVDWNLEEFKKIWREKIKLNECIRCKYNTYCKWHYKYWVNFVWEEYVRNKIKDFIQNVK